MITTDESRGFALYEQAMSGVFNPSTSIDIPEEENTLWKLVQLAIAEEEQSMGPYETLWLPDVDIIVLPPDLIGPRNRVPGIMFSQGSEASFTVGSTELTDTGIDVRYQLLSTRHLTEHGVIKVDEDSAVAAASILSMYSMKFADRVAHLS